MNKKGFVNVFITIGIVILIFVLLTCFMIYFQINHIKTKIKNEMQYIIYDSVVAINKDKASLGVYSVDKSKLENVISGWCKNKEKDIAYAKQISVKEVTVYSKEKSVNIKVKLNVKLKPIINIGKEIETTITEEYDISLLKYERSS